MYINLFLTYSLGEQSLVIILFAILRFTQLHNLGLQHSDELPLDSHNKSSHVKLTDEQCTFTISHL